MNNKTRTPKMFIRNEYSELNLQEKSDKLAMISIGVEFLFEIMDEYAKYRMNKLEIKEE